MGWNKARRFTGSSATADWPRRALSRLRPHHTRFTGTTVLLRQDNDILCSAHLVAGSCCGAFVRCAIFWSIDHHHQQERRHDHFSTTTSSVDAGSDMVNNKGLTVIANYNEQHRLTSVLACNNEDQEHFDDWLQTSAVYFGL